MTKIKSLVALVVLGLAMLAMTSCSRSVEPRVEAQARQDNSTEGRCRRNYGDTPSFLKCVQEMTDANAANWQTFKGRDLSVAVPPAPSHGVAQVV